MEDNKRKPEKFDTLDDEERKQLRKLKKKEKAREKRKESYFP